MNKLNLMPNEDRIFILPSKEEEKTANGIYITDTAKEKPHTGVVVAAGPGKFSETLGEVVPLSFKVGDKVMYGRYGGTAVPIDGIEYLTMKATDVWAFWPA